jgi:hypothetical protein
MGTTATFTLPAVRVIRDAGAAPIAEAIAAA